LYVSFKSSTFGQIFGTSIPHPNPPPKGEGTRIFFLIKDWDRRTSKGIKKVISFIIICSSLVISEILLSIKKLIISSFSSSNLFSISKL